MNSAFALMSFSPYLHLNTMGSAVMETRSTLMPTSKVDLFMIACGQRLFKAFAPVTLCHNFTTSLVYLSSSCFIAVKRMKQLAVPDGIMLLAVPTGFDQLHWNIHRVYGRARLPLLLSSWKVEGIFGDKFKTVTQLQPPHFASPQVLMKVSWM
jgi:hypothetical protein